MFHSYFILLLSMGRSVRFHYRLLIFFMAATIFLSCNSEKKEIENEKEIITIPQDQEAVQLIQSGLQLIPDWIDYWKQAETDFSVSDFVMGKSEVYEQLEWPEENFIDEQHLLFSHLIRHPEEKGVVDIYSYKIVYPEENKPFFNPDSEVIFFKNNGMRERLLFIGPSGTFDEARWVSPDHLMIAGRFESADGLVSPKIWLIEISGNRYFEFDHPVASQKVTKHGYLKQKFKHIDLSDEV
jgi:hypothetical protein